MYFVSDDYDEDGLPLLTSIPMDAEDSIDSNSCELDAIEDAEKEETALRILKAELDAEEKKKEQEAAEAANAASLQQFVQNYKQFFADM